MVLVWAKSVNELNAYHICNMHSSVTSLMIALSESAYLSQPNDILMIRLDACGRGVSILFFRLFS